MDEFNAQLATRLGVNTVDWMEYYMEAVEPIREMHDIVGWASQHYRIGLLSNIMPGFIKAMIANGKLPDVQYDAIVDSSQIGAIKPESVIYEIAQDKAAVESDQILFVDDSRTNLMAAERQGWRVMWFDDYRPQESSNKIKTALEF